MLIGKGSPHELLRAAQVLELCAQAFESRSLTGKRILAIIPDNTRSAPIDLMFRTVYQLLADRVARLDFLIALGTHPPLSEAGISQRLGLGNGELRTRYAKARIFNHAWNDAQQLARLGTIAADTVAEISNGMMHEPVTITINKMIFDYDLLMIIGPTFPHEVVGFSGGNKYLFPGIAGREIIDMFHWLGALITSPVIIGTKHTPVRRVVDRAAAFVPVERMCLALVVKGSDLAGLYIGTPEEAWSAAADLSREIHIIYKERPFAKVLSCAPAMYNDLWVGGKCTYKLEPVVTDGGELIIYAPHIREISVSHGDEIRRIGYHVRDYFLKQMDKFRDVPGGILAHATHVKGVGTFENGIEKPRINVVLATQIPAEVCRSINLGYRDPAAIKIEEWQDREDEGILFVPKAGEILYRLRDDPFKQHA
ncbi:MAG: lactate racemase domain-containing protein [candidate division KSB1 bacterium]|nr:lactate racemase domain-containing protein [candidate division KSB1 bacterium]MDZ7273559.1 lactate racemase domain-containing protein [candidate division KSB1 bacterium]MDZ7286850.1 lactate racemase domain-containing protein [candidate division KSB1 bacterium]MDZ7299793.1 lactate racemase domain-containing protein [candidate division KSB1 bacterium]MDZ7309413.1 lactate racemase domain-containing protein [candidate division KSB1 bacterium]